MFETNTSDQVFSELQALNSEVLTTIRAYAEKAEMTGLFKANDWLRQAVNLLKRHESLKIEARQLIDSGRELLEIGASGSEAHEESADAPGYEGGGGKPRGRQCRNAFVQREGQRGNPLTKVRGQLYKTSTGVIVGIGYGKEDEKRKQCFIGLPAGQFQEIVLICELLKGVVRSFWLPRDFADEYAKHLSVSKQYNQVKFVVVERPGGHFDLSVPGADPVEITRFMDAKPLNCPTSSFD